MSTVSVASLFTTNNSNGSPVVEKLTALVVPPRSKVEISEFVDVVLSNVTVTVPAPTGGGG